MSSFRKAFLIAFCGIAMNTATAWDGVGHRLTAAVAVNFLSEETKIELIELLQQHPRFQQDFIAEIPGYVNRQNRNEMTTWLLGQAAYWPDIARGFPDAEADKYNRPPWHYTDGAWVRGAADKQGNSYVGIDRFSDIHGEDPASIVREEQVHNVATGLDYNTLVLADSSRSAAQRAVALCWVLHLMGDIHQPLHTGSLYSAAVFDRGDRGGNGVPTEARNLHSRWDGALTEEGIEFNLPLIIEVVSDFGNPLPALSGYDWTDWMRESRAYLETEVYTDAMRAEIAGADTTDRELKPSTLSAAYVSNMKDIARLRIGMAGLRQAAWFEANL